MAMHFESIVAHVRLTAVQANTGIWRDRVAGAWYMSMPPLLTQCVHLQMGTVIKQLSYVAELARVPCIVNLLDGLQFPL